MSRTPLDRFEPKVAVDALRHPADDKPLAHRRGYFAKLKGYRWSSLDVIEARTFGYVELNAGESGDAKALLAQSKRFALFCYLALPKPGTLHRRDVLLGLFWPESDQEHGRADLRQALRFIRRALGGDSLLHCGADEVGVNPDLVWCDVAEFQRAVDEGRWTDAVGLYRGEFLQGFHVSGNLEFERWLDAQRSRLSRAYAGALERAAEKAVAGDDVRAAVEYSERLVEHDRYNSRYTVKLMEVLVAAGDPANALLCAERHRELLREELGIAPPPDFEAQVERTKARSGLDGDAKPLAAQSLRPLSGTVGVETPASDRQQAAGGAPRMRFPAALGAALTLLMIVLGGALAISLTGRDDITSARVGPTVAVMPLATLGLPEDSAFARGLTDAITRRLAGISDLAVVSTLGLHRDGSGDRSLARVAEDLRVKYLLTGTVQRELPSDPQGGIRVSVQLVRARDGVVTWAQGFDVEPVGLFEAYGEIGIQVASALNMKLLESERRALAASPTESPQAYEYYLLGNAYFEQGFPIRWELRNAVEMYQRAIEADSGFALAYARLSMAHGGLFAGWFDRSDERLAMQLEAADEALRLEPGLPEGHIARGFHYYWAHSDHEQALAEFELAREGLADDYWYLYLRASVERRMGSLPEAAKGYAAASDLRPLVWLPALEAGQTYRVLRRYEEAHRYLDRYMAVVPSRPYAYLRKALAYLEESGDVARAREVLRSVPEQLPYEVMIAEAALDYCMPGWFRLLRVLCGDCRQAIERMQLKDGQLWHYYLGKALLYGRLGDRQHERIYNDSAAALLEELIEGRPEDAHYHADLGLAYAALGRKEAALREARLAASLSSPSRDAWACCDAVNKLAEVHAMFSEADSAVAQLELLFSAFAAGEESGHYINPMASVPLMRIDPIWDSIRDHPAFQALLEHYDPLP